MTELQSYQGDFLNLHGVSEDYRQSNGVLCQDGSMYSLQKVTRYLQNQINSVCANHKSLEKSLTKQLSQMAEPQPSKPQEKVVIQPDDKAV